jgi:molybdenum cofactor biosynthesis enzyme MoaA
MRLTGLHLLLTYQCTLECGHCFTWGSPWQSGTMTLQDIRHYASRDTRGNRDGL